MQNQSSAKQFAPDNISEVIVGEESSTNIDYDNNNVNAQAEPAIDDKDVDPPLLYSVPEEFKLDLLDQYDKPYLIKVVKYLHKRIERLVKQLRDKDIKRRNRVLEQQDEIIGIKGK